MRLLHYFPLFTLRCHGKEGTFSVKRPYFPTYYAPLPENIYEPQGKATVDHPPRETPSSGKKAPSYSSPKNIPSKKSDLDSVLLA